MSLQLGNPTLIRTWFLGSTRVQTASQPLSVSLSLCVCVSARLSVVTTATVSAVVAAAAADDVDRAYAAFAL